MHRRDFLLTSAAASITLPTWFGCAEQSPSAPAPVDVKAVSAGKEQECALTYASPLDAMKSPAEKLMYLVCTYAGTKVDKPDYLATIDVDPASKTFAQVIHRLPMPNVGDELHHFGWNACSSCHGDPAKHRQYLIVPGLASGRIHIIDVAKLAEPKMHKVIEAEEIAKAADLSGPHTVHCLADGQIMISMLGNAQGELPGGFLLLNQDFEITGRWDKEGTGPQFNYDYWYQPRHNVMISSEWGAPNTVKQGFKIEDVQAGKYGRSLNFWNWKERTLAQSIDLGETGMIPLEVRFHHDPESTHGFVGAALSSSIWHWDKADDKWKADKVVQVESIEHEGWPFPVPGLITDLVLSLDDRWLYFSNWLHGDIRQYDVSNPAEPKLTGQLWLGGVLGKGTEVAGRKLGGGPQMLQLSRDGRRLYVTNSLYSAWDNQFYPKIAEEGSYLLQIDCNVESGGLKVNEKSLLDFSHEPDGPVRAHEMRFPGGDCTSDIWV